MPILRAAENLSWAKDLSLWPEILDTVCRHFVLQMFKAESLQSVILGSLAGGRNSFFDLNL